MGQFDLVGIPPAPRGVPQVEVTFDIDANGIVNVTAKDKATNKEQSIRIQANGGLSDADIDGMVKDAEAHAAEDKKRKELVEAKNQADAAVHHAEKAVAEHGDKIPADDKAAIESAIAELKAVSEGEDAEAIKTQTQALLHGVDEARRGHVQGATGTRATAANGGAAAGSEAGGEDTVVDAEFEEVDDDDRG